MLDRLRQSYWEHSWVRLAAALGLCLVALLLGSMTGGFPPWAWRFLLQVFPQLSQLWAQRGLSMLAPLFGLLLLSLTMCILWGLLLAAAILMIRNWLKMHGASSAAAWDFEQEEPASPVTPVIQPHVPFQAQERAISLEAGTALDAGIKRRGQPNEDSLLALPALRASRGGRQQALPKGLFVVADGMGGHGNGQEASRLAVAALHDAMQLALLDGPEDDYFEELLAEGVHNANLAVYQRNRQQQSEMGTTITAALVVGAIAYVANVGDSRTYLYRAGEGLRQITRDHSAVARLVEAGAISRQDVYAHPKRNEIYRCLGHSAAVKVDTFRVPLEAGDLLLLCSDGLWEMVYDADIENIIEASLPSSSQVCAQLVQAALRGGGKDNISVIAVSVKFP